MYPWEARKKRKKKLHQLLKDTGIIIVKSRDTSIVLGCFTRKPLKNGKERKFIQDNDTVIMRAYSEKDGLRIGFGECNGKVLPAID